MRPHLAPTAISILLVALSVAACQGATDSPRRGPLGKADRLGSCEGACGGQSNQGTCWCDSRCASFGDCCDDREAVCGADQLDGGAIADAAVIDAGAGDVVLTYQFGNQITGSELTILADGSIVHGERTCCPPHTDAVSDAPLAEAELDALQADAAAVAALGTAITAGELGCEGCKSGALVVRVAGVDHVVHRITMLSGDGATPNEVERSLATDAAASIQALVATRVLEDLP